MSKKIIFCSGILFGLLLIPPISVVADSWEETFDSSTLDTWIVKYGNWYIDNGVLAVNETDYVDLYEGDATSIWHPQTQLTGTWSFDILHTGEEDFGTIFYFIGSGITNNQFHPTDGYVIHLWGNGNIDLDYVANCCFQYSPGSYHAAEQHTGWQHISVSRNVFGEMSVFLNGTSIINATHNLVLESENITITTETLGVKFDNIIYNDEIHSSLTSSSETISDTSLSSPRDLTTSVPSSKSKEDEGSVNALSGMVGVIFTTFSLRKINSAIRSSIIR